MLFISAFILNFIPSFYNRGSQTAALVPNKVPDGMQKKKHAYNLYCHSINIFLTIQHGLKTIIQFIHHKINKHSLHLIIII